MVTITFPDRATEKRALAFLLGRFSGRVLRSGEHLIPATAIGALAEQNIPFTVKGMASDDQHGLAAVPPWHLTEVARRRAEAAEKPGVGRPWRDALGEIRAESDRDPGD
jgi:hypothetical protein